MPVDMTIIMLGTNDLRPAYDRSPRQIAEALGGFVEDLRIYAEEASDRMPRVLLVNPVSINKHAKSFSTGSDKENQEIADKSKQLAEYLHQTAIRLGCDFFDADAIAATGDDGIHMDASSHERLASSIAEAVRETAG